MELGTLLVIVAGILVVLDLAIGRPWTPNGPVRARGLTPVAVLLIVIALLVGFAPLIRT